jgi:hypothetical protein
MAYPFELNKVYTFNTLAPGLLGSVIKNAKLTGILDFESAIKYDEILFKYRNIYRILPPGTPDRPELCTYYKFKAENNSTIILADQWIDESTVTLIESLNLKVTITNLSLADVPRIRNALLALGYTEFTIEQI